MQIMFSLQMCFYAVGLLVPPLPVNFTTGLKVSVVFLLIWLPTKAEEMHLEENEMDSNFSSGYLC